MSDVSDQAHGDGYASPEEAARSDIPARYARVLSVSVSPDGDEALVLLGTNEESYLYPYEVHCIREGDRWFEGSGSNGVGLGWSRRADSAGRSVGVLHLSGEVPPGVREVVVEWKKGEHRVPVSGGYFCFVDWHVPADFEHALSRLRVVRHVHEDGTERAVEPDPLLQGLWELRETPFGDSAGADRTE